MIDDVTIPNMTNLNQRVRTGSRSRRESSRAAIRRTILEATRELLVQEGYEALSLRKVAERIGYTATTIYRHFQDKDALLYAATEDAFEQLAARLAAAADPASQPFQALERVALGYIDFGLDQPAHYRLLFMTRPDLLWHRAAGQPASRVERLGMLRASVARALATVSTSTRDVLAASNALWAVTHGTVALALSIPHLPRSQAREFGALATRAFLRGLATSG
jgi:AcrR family transcriptional regulator